MELLKSVRLGVWMGLSCLGLTVPIAQANVFTTPRLVAPGEFALGMEPELISSGGVGLGVNLRYTQGLTDSNNWYAFLGTGGGSRQFRAGGAFTFDIFPDVGNQPGIGIAVQAQFVQISSIGTVEISGIPYIHKQFEPQGFRFDPFLAIPIGLALAQGQYQVISTLAVGSNFKHSDHLSSTVEVGIGLSHSTHYVSGGVSYYH